MKNNRKGFTLVELLAVIVILAILMVSAGAGVMATMNNSKVNTFKNELLTAIDGAQNMYSELSMSTSDSNKFIKSNTGDTGTGKATYAGMCVTLSGLVNNGYLDKDLGNYGGVILIEVPYDGGATKYTIWAHNSTYGVNGFEKNVVNKLKFNKKNNTAKSDGDKEATAYNGGGIGVITELTGIKSLAKEAMGIDGDDEPVGVMEKETDCDTDENKTKATCNGKSIVIVEVSGVPFTSAIVLVILFTGTVIRLLTGVYVVPPVVILALL